MSNILVFGSSIAYGAWDTKGGWVARLRTFFDKKTLKNPKFPLTERPMVYNLGVQGDSSNDLLTRFETETRARVEKQQEDIFIIEIGINDSIVMQDKSNYVSTPEFSKNVRLIIQLAKKYTSNIIILGITPVDEKLVNPVPWNPDYSYTHASIQKYSQILKMISAQEKVTYIDIIKIFNKNKSQKLLKDGLHPNDQGHELIFKVVFNKISQQTLKSMKDYEREKYNRK